MITHLTKDNIRETEPAILEFWEETLLPGKFNYDYWVSKWTEVLEMNMGTMIAYRTDGEVKGLMGAIIFPCWMTGDMEALEACWYVRKPYRGTTIGIKVLKEYERWAKERGAVRAKMVHLESINADMLEKIYLRMGYSKLQRAYSKELYERVQD